jgi:hypothetical protein
MAASGLRVSSASRRGVGALVAFVAWVLTIAMIYALMSGQAQSGALTGLVRVTGMRTLLLAAQSALAEATFVLRHPPDGGSELLAGIQSGRDAGDAYDPVGTRQLYESDVAAGRLGIEKVHYEVALEPTQDDEPWQIDLTVRVRHTFAGTTLTRQLRRRLLARVCRVHSLSGPKEGQVVYTSLMVLGQPLTEVVEP